MGRFGNLALVSQSDFFKMVVLSSVRGKPSLRAPKSIHDVPHVYGNWRVGVVDGAPCSLRVSVGGLKALTVAPIAVGVSNKMMIF